MENENKIVIELISIDAELVSFDPAHLEAQLIEKKWNRQGGFLLPMLESLATGIIDLLDAQQQYFKGRDPVQLTLCKRKEQDLRKRAEGYRKAARAIKAAGQ